MKETVIERGAIERLDSLMKPSGKVLVVTDDGVPVDYPSKVASYFSEAFILTIPQGESSKSFQSLESIISFLAGHSFSRHDCLIAVGGGMVGDLGGFAASCYMRGIDFYNIPTTLLSQIDASVGGKTAINFDCIKNVVGSFYPAKKVIIDPSVLSTLDDRQFRSGLAEAVKMACTSSSSLFSFLEDCTDARGIIDRVVRECVAIKEDVVRRDPQEGGLRKVLNFGHTVGHAIESASSGKLSHGESVAIGMTYFCSPRVLARLKPLLEKFSLPASTDITPDVLISYIRHDKKASGSGISTVYVDSVGSFEFRTLTFDEIEKIVYGK